MNILVEHDQIPKANQDFDFNSPIDGVDLLTPEGVSLNFRGAGIGSRILARAVDIALQLILLILFGIVAGLVGLIGSFRSAQILYILLYILIIFGYPAVFESRYKGKTLGKKILGIKVITLSGEPLSFSKASLRSLIGLIETFFFFICIPFALFTKNGQRLGDLAAGTVVIKEKKTIQIPIRFAPPSGMEDYCKTLDTSLLTPAQYSLTREYLFRARGLRFESREALADEFAHAISKQTKNVIPANMHPGYFVYASVVAHQSRQGDFSEFDSFGMPYQTFSINSWDQPNF